MKSITVINTSLLQHSTFPSGVGFYPDEKDGVKGYNTDPNRGADTFSPFKSGASFPIIDGGGILFENGKFLDGVDFVPDFHYFQNYPLYEECRMYDKNTGEYSYKWLTNSTSYGWSDTFTCIVLNCSKVYITRTVNGNTSTVSASISKSIIPQLGLYSNAGWNGFLYFGVVPSQANSGSGQLLSVSSMVANTKVYIEKIWFE